MPYTGFEQGPIRPPSEAKSLLIRATRNCPWNRCTFCPVYKGEKYSRRPVEHVIRDIDAVHKHISMLKNSSEKAGATPQSAVADIDDSEKEAFYAAYAWFRNGMASVFLQDANSLIMKSGDLTAILLQIKNRFPEVKRITSYARSQTIAKMKDEDMAELARAGLNRIHIGLESGSDCVLKAVKKGATSAIHIEAGKRVKRAGIELSEYVMPGLGGRERSVSHATDTAETLNRIDPDFIRIRTLAIPDYTELACDVREGRVTACSESELTQELYLFVDNLKGISSFVISDHILNPFEDLEGKLPDNKEKMLRILKSYLELDPQEQSMYLLGRRMGIFRSVSDMADSRKREHVAHTAWKWNVTPHNINEVVAEIVKRFI